jgi:transposase-like protein
MRFRHSFGPRGQKVLEAFGEGATIEELAIAHGVELNELQRWVKQWGEEGLVRGG